MASSTMLPAEDLSPEKFVHSALELVACLPVDANPAFSRGLVRRCDKSAVPPPLLFSPLAHSLERRANLVLSRNSKALLAKAPASPWELAHAEVSRKLQGALDGAAGASQAILDAAAAHCIGLLRAMDELGAAIRAGLHLPVPDAPSGFGFRSRGQGQGLEPLFGAVLPGDGVAEIVIAQSVFNFLNIYNTLLVVRLILTWFPNPPEVILSPLSTICDPYLNLFRGIIPPLGGTLDFSPILAFVVLNVFTNAAAAIPAEIPPEEAPLRGDRPGKSPGQGL